MRPSISLRFDPALLILVAPLVWVLGISLVAYHAMVALFLLRLLWQLRARGIRVPLPALLLLSVAILLTISALLNANGRMDRLAPAIYNASFWALGALLTIVISNGRASTPQGIARIGSTATALLLLLAPAALLLALAISEPVALPSLVSLLVDTGDLPPLVRDSTSLTLTNPDWVGDEETTRVTVLSPYPTALAGLGLGLLVLAHLRHRPASSLGIIAVGATAITTVVSASRVGMGALALYLLALLWFRLPLKTVHKIVLLLGATSMILVFLVATGVVQDALERALSFRGDSTLLRVLLYAESVSAVINGNLLLGEGVKIRGLTGEVPLGSHSTYVGLFYRGGLLTAAAFLMLAWSVAHAVIARRRARGSARAARATILLSGLVAFAGFLALEDIDAPQLLSVVFFLIVGLGVSDGPRPPSRTKEPRVVDAPVPVEPSAAPA